MGFDMSGLPLIRKAPFSGDEISHMEWYQMNSPFRPYKCLRNHGMIPMRMTKDGLVCPLCKVVQDWVLESTFKLKHGPAYNRDSKEI